MFLVAVKKPDDVASTSYTAALIGVQSTAASRPASRPGTVNPSQKPSASDDTTYREPLSGIRIVCVHYRLL